MTDQTSKNCTKQKRLAHKERQDKHKKRKVRLYSWEIFPIDDAGEEEDYDYDDDEEEEEEEDDYNDGNIVEDDIDYGLDDDNESVSVG